MDNFSINLIKIQKHGKHRLVDKLLFFGINTLKDFYDYDQKVLQDKLFQISEDLVYQLQEFQQHAQQVKDKFTKLEVQDMEFVDSSEEEQQQQEQAGNNNSIEDSIIFYKSIPLIIPDCQENQQNLNYYYYNTDPQKKIQKQLNQVINFGEISEIVGSTGAGKTQICMQILQNFCIHCKLTKKNCQSMIIDFDGSFSAKRFLQFSQNVFQNYNLQEETALKSIQVFKHIEQISLNGLIENIKFQYFQQSNQQLKLIIIEGILIQIKARMQKFEDQKEIHQFLNDLQILAKQYDCAIVFTNQIQQFQKNKNQFKLNSICQKSEYGCNTSSFVSNKILLQKMQLKNLYQPQQQQDTSVNKINVQTYMNGVQDNRKNRNKKTVLIVQKCSSYLDRAIEVPIETIFTENYGVQFCIK